MPRIECTVLYQIGAGYCQLNLKNECIGIFRQMLVDRRFEEFYVIQSASAIELIRVLIEKEMHLDKIETYIKKIIRPKIQGDGGEVEFESLSDDGTLTLIFRGECSKCLILNRCVDWIAEEVLKNTSKLVKIKAVRKKPYFWDN